MQSTNKKSRLSELWSLLGSSVKQKSRGFISNEVPGQPEIFPVNQYDDKAAQCKGRCGFLKTDSTGIKENYWFDRQCALLGRGQQHTAGKCQSSTFSDESKAI